jgi:hypothetical protein
MVQVAGISDAEPLHGTAVANRRCAFVQRAVIMKISDFAAQGFMGKRDGRAVVNDQKTEAENAGIIVRRLLAGDALFRALAARPVVEFVDEFLFSRHKKRISESSIKMQYNFTTMGGEECLLLL